MRPDISTRLSILCQGILLAIALLASVNSYATTVQDVDHEVITIWSQGVRLEGDIYKPKGLAADAKLPGILLVHGWGGTKQHLQNRYGPQFAELGFIVLAFDYKGWGKSDGPLLLYEPLPQIEETGDVSVNAKHIRKIVNPLSMLEDARAALHYLVGEPQVIANNIGIWGTSLGGGIALVTAAKDDRIKAYVDQIGAVNFKANLEMITDKMSQRWETQQARGNISPYPGPEAVITPALKGFPDWIAMKRYDPFSYVEKLNVPTLIIDAEEEELFARDKNGMVLHAAIKDRLETKYVTYPGKHYDMYAGEQYEHALADAQQWFVKYLKGSEAGPLLYKTHCALCHSNPAVRAPTFSALKGMSQSKVLFAMTEGKMKDQASALSDEQREALARYLTAGVEDPRAWEATADCGSAYKAPQEMTALVGGWGLGNKNLRYQPAKLAGMNAEDLPNLDLAWAQGFPGTTEMRSQPVVTEDSLYIGVQDTNTVYAFDLDSGCLQWTHRGVAPIRSALSFGRMPDTDQPILFYGDVGGNVNVISAADGTTLWSVSMGLTDAMVTGTPVLQDDSLYVPLSTSEIGKTFRATYECCKAHGGVSALDLRTGKILWTYETTAPAQLVGENSVGTPLWGPSGAPVWTTPAIDTKRNLLYIGTGENYSHPATATSDAIIALDLDSGKPVWTYQALADDVYTMACRSYMGFPDGPSCPENYGPDFDFGASVIIATDKNGKDILLAGQKSGDVYALDPDNKGAVIWHKKLSDGTPVGGIHWGMSVIGDKVFVPIADPDWPIVGWKYQSMSGLVALDITSGEQAWRHKASRGCDIDLTAFNDTTKTHTETWPACHFLYGFSGAAVGIDGAVLAGALNGKLNAFSTKDGALLWQFDTNRSFDTLNGVKAHGGALDNASTVAAGGRLIVQSGYSYINQMPGNVLLVFKLKSTE
ncbi:MAG: alpha/beta fold hydrolase [Pseudomonadales bacterium]